MQLSQKLNFYFSLAYLGFIVATRGNQALSCSKCGCGQRVKCLSLFYGKPLKAASTFAKSFRGMEIAEFLTDNFIKKSGNSTSQECLVMYRCRLCFNDEAFQGIRHISLLAGNVPDAMV